MSWVALDRASRLLGANSAWDRAREEIAADICANAGPHLVQSLSRPDMDAALLLTFGSAFPLDAKVLAMTVEVVEDELRVGDFVYRYRTYDGVAGLHAPCVDRERRSPRSI
jgi:GH15 family glucan-1,4-alpha-glucosidase